MRRNLLWPLIIGVVAVVVVGAVLVSSKVLRSGGPPSDRPAAESIAGADLSGTGPGTLISAMTMPEFSRTQAATPMKAARVVYRSTEGDTGRPTVVSGSVFIPTGPPPPGGWPVVSLAHGSLGIDQPCAPSLSPSLLGSIDAVAMFIDAGYAVALADYQGLGEPGVHPYLDARTAGRNVIDAVRALRHTFRDVSARWSAWGGSQGGGAAWGAGEQAATYAPEMPPLGVVALAPAADVAGLVDLAVQHQLDRDQMAALVVIVESLARLHPDINRDDYRRGPAAAQWDVLTACSGDKVHERQSVIEQLEPSDIAPSTPQAADRLRGYLSAWALPQQRLAAPMSVVYGGADEYLKPEWTAGAIRRACALGGVVVSDFQPENHHGDLDTSTQLGWLSQRFAGMPVTDGCVGDS